MHGISISVENHLLEQRYPSFPLVLTLLVRKCRPSQHTHTGPVWDLSGFAGWAGRGILQWERHGTRQSTPASLQRTTRIRQSSTWLFHIVTDASNTLLSLIHAYAHVVNAIKNNNLQKRLSHFKCI